MRTVLGRLAVAVLILFSCGAGAVTTSATQTASSTPSPEAPRFSIYPVGDYEHGWFEITVEPGSSVQLTAGVINAAGAPYSLRTYVANASNPVNGGFSAGTDEEEPTGATNWVGFPAETFELAAGEIREIDFTVTVPADTMPGEYVAGLVVQTAGPVEIPGTTTFQQIVRNTVSVEITVPGEMTSGFELGSPEIVDTADMKSLNIPITNTGTARVRPAGQLVMTTPEGKVVSTTDVEMGSVYGGNTTSIRIIIPDQLAPGEYLVSLDLADEATGATASITDTPVALAEPEIEEAPGLEIGAVSISPNGDPVQYAAVAATITNHGQDIPTANVALNVQLDGEEVESYLLAQNQALPRGETVINQRYIPLDGWKPGVYSFQLVISSVNGTTETMLTTFDVEETITVP